jgi:hypothetical protein
MMPNSQDMAFRAELDELKMKLGEQASVAAPGAGWRDPHAGVAAQGVQSVVVRSFAANRVM